MKIPGLDDILTEFRKSTEQMQETLTQMETTLIDVLEVLTKIEQNTRQ